MITSMQGLALANMRNNAHTNSHDLPACSKQQLAQEAFFTNLHAGNVVSLDETKRLASQWWILSPTNGAHSATTYSMFVRAQQQQQQQQQDQLQLRQAATRFAATNLRQ